MKTKFLLPLCISVVMGAMVFISCEHEQNYSESIQNEEVNQFLQSSYGKDFLENFHFQIEDLNVEKLASLSQKNDVKLLCIPVTKNEKELGRLCVISNSQGRIFHLTSSLRTPKFFVKEFSYFLMPCHQHGLRINLLVQR